MISYDLNEIPSSILAIGAHPDDIEFNAFGTLAKWASVGSKIDMAIMTDGSKGSWDPDQNIDELKEIRRIEAKMAADTIGADLHFLNYVDGELEFNKDTVKAIAKLIRQVKPQMVITHDPFKKYRLHPDHRNCGQIVLDAIVAARDPHFLKDLGILHHRPHKILLFEPEVTDHLETIQEFINTKIEALLKHKSQYITTMDITDPENPTQIMRFKNWIDELAHSAGNPIGKPAECFKLIDKV